jgi:hypothetical protein
MGGGELARDTEADVITEASSEINSLAGVPGWLIDAILACLDRSLSTVGTCGNDADAANKAGGVSVLGVATTRNVLGAVRLTGEPVEVAAGLAGSEFAVDDIDRGRIVFN